MSVLYHKVRTLDYKVRLGVKSLDHKVRLGVRTLDHKVRVRVRVRAGAHSAGVHGFCTWVRFPAQPKFFFVFSKIVQVFMMVKYQKYFRNQCRQKIHCLVLNVRTCYEEVFCSR